MRQLFILFMLALTLGGCSQFSYNRVSVAWHNTNAHFNSLVIARENMKAAEKTLFEGRNDVYSQLLPILLPIDSTFTPKNKNSAANAFADASNGNTGFGQNNANNDFNINGNTSQSLNNSANAIGNNINNATNSLNNNGNTTGSGLSSTLLPSKDFKTNLNEVVKKTSLIAERHSNSKYLDEAYFLLGKARLYKGDYLHAIEVFKYINTKGDDENQKHAALIGLMRAYIEEDDFETALKVSENLRSLELNDKNTIDFYITKAYLHELSGEYATAAGILEEALKLMKKGNEKARLEYITGQLYDLTGKPSQAATHYANVEKLHPDYELTFYAKLNKLLDGSPQMGLENDFKKMLADRKNKELKDQIYFTMGSIDEKNGNYDKAITNYQKSVKASMGGQQKAYTFLQLAELHYTKLQNYSKASAYYDSCLLVLPKSAVEYDKISRRATTLGNFVGYKKTIKTEDSLQNLTSLNPMELDKYLEKSIQEKELAKNAAIELANKKSAENNKEEILANNEADFKRWELYDPITVGINKNAFTQIWGSRVLEDNWRRKDKDGSTGNFKPEKNIDPTTASAVETTRTTATENSAEKLANEKKILYQSIPTTPEKLAQSQKRIEEAYYELGKLYQLQFNEPENAKKSFETLLAKFPNTQHEAEVLYFLIVMNNGGENVYKTTLLSKFPHSTYARKLARGNIAITSDTEAQANLAYKQAFEVYSGKDYVAALKLTEDNLLKFTGTSIEDKFAMLRILLLAKTEQKEPYTQALKEFVQSYANSDLLPKAKEMLKIVAP